MFRVLSIVVLLALVASGADLERANRRRRSTWDWQIKVKSPDGLIYTYMGTGSKPTSVAQLGLDDSWTLVGDAPPDLIGGNVKEDFVREHNEWRQKEGVGLPDLVWDEELAALARGNVDTCKAEHDSKGQSTSKFTKIGQNLYYSSRTDVGPAMAARDSLASWMAEKEFYTYSTNACTDVCGHYTQVVWKTSTHVGCAVSKNCPSGTYVACNYGPPGNYEGERPY